MVKQSFPFSVQLKKRDPPMLSNLQPRMCPEMKSRILKAIIRTHLKEIQSILEFF